MAAESQSHREPLRTTLARTILIALVVGGGLAVGSARSGRPIRWPLAVVLVLWLSFGGHWVELWYLDWLGPRLPVGPTARRAARLGTWFLGGCLLGVGMVLSARAITGARLDHRPAWWFTGIVFIGVELVAHAALHARRRPSFFDGRG